ncbi:MAG TPA: NosD domain-containing protein, partial [Candidatus Acidoferrum sp.]|nr:NosD domain-containing protein [Candidatus Acidoferrum sp.]
NFGVDPYSLLFPANWGLLPSCPNEISPYLMNDVDKSNTINGKPVYWWINRHDGKVPADAGYVVLVNSTGMIVQSLQISNNAEGILLVCVNDTIISNNTLTNSGYGAMIESFPPYIQTSFNDSLSFNKVTSNGGGFLVRSDNCTLSHNFIDKNILGMLINSGSYDLIISNTITNSALPKTEDWILGYSLPYYGGALFYYSDGAGIVLYGGNNTFCYNLVQNNAVGIGTVDYLNSGNRNIIYHNNFINNTYQTCLASTNFWDDGYPSGGNYWSSNNDTDIFNGPFQNQTGSDAIADVHFQIFSETLQLRGLLPELVQLLMNESDSYPLMAPISHFDIGTWNGTSYAIDVVSSAEVTNFSFDLNATRPFIGFNVTGDTAAEQFSRVTIPDGVILGLWKGNYTVLVDGVFWPFTSYADNASTYVYLNYTGYEHQIIILPIVSAQSITVGVKKGDSIKYNVAYPESELPSRSTVWTKIDVLNVTGTSVTTLIVYHSRDGSETNETRTFEVDNSTYPYVIPSDSQVGDTVYVGAGPVVITGEGTCVFAGVSRTVLTATARVAGDEWIYYCWDKQTGIMLGENCTGQYALNAAETNMWNNGLFLGLDWWVWAIILGETVTLVGALAFDRRRRKGKSEIEPFSAQTAKVRN